MVLVIIIGLVVWTVTSPAPLPVVSHSELSGGLFSVSSTTASYNVSDASGNYRLEFGMDYSKNLTAGATTRIAIYCALVSEEVSSAFTRGIAISLQSSSVVIDNATQNNVIVTSKLQSGLQTYYFQISSLPSKAGNHSLELKLLFSIIDVNYIGNSLGNYQPVNVNGTLFVIS